MPLILSGVSTSLRTIVCPNVPWYLILGLVRVSHISSLVFYVTIKNVTLAPKELQEVDQLWVVVPFYGSLLLIVALLFTYRPTDITCQIHIFNWSLHSLLLDKWVALAMPLLMCVMLNDIFLINGLFVFRLIQAPIYH